MPAFDRFNCEIEKNASGKHPITVGIEGVVEVEPAVSDAVVPFPKNKPLKGVVGLVPERLNIPTPMASDVVDGVNT